jgi:hypothetical protein
MGSNWHYFINPLGKHEVGGYEVSRENYFEILKKP